MYGVIVYFAILIIYVLVSDNKDISSMNIFGLLLVAILLLGTLAFFGLSIYAYAVYFYLMRKGRRMEGTISIKTTNNEASYLAASNISWIKILAPGSFSAGRNQQNNLKTATSDAG